MKQLFTIVWLSVFLFPISNIIAQEAQDKFTLLPTREARLLAEALAEINNPVTSIAHLMVLLQEAPSPAKADAARVLGERGATEAIPVLQKVAEEMRSGSVGAAARVAIIRIQTREKPTEDQAEAYAALLNEPDTPHETQLAVLEALKHIGSPVVGEDILKFARAYREHKSLYLKALVLLSVIGTKEALPALEEWLNRPFIPPAHMHDFEAMARVDPPEVRKELQTAYWRLKTHGLPPTKMAQILEEGLRKGMASGGAIEILAAMGEPGLAVLRRAAQTKNWPQHQSDFIRQLGLSQDKKSQEMLINIYNDRTRNEYDRAAAMGALVRIGHPAAGEILFRILRDSTQERLHKRWTMYALWRLADLKENGIDRIKIEEATWQRLLDGPPIASVAAQALRTVGSPRSVPRLVTMLRDEKRIHAHIAALTTIGFIGDNSPETLAFLFNEMVSNENQHKRALSAAALARIGNPIAIPVLVEQAGREKNSHPFLYQVSAIWLLGERNEQPRQQAIQALVKLKEDRKEPWAQEPMDEALLRLQRTEQQEPAVAQ